MGLFDLFSDQPAQDAAKAQQAGLQAGYDQGTGFINQGTQALQTQFGRALQPFQQNFATAQGGQNAYANATGAHGQQGFNQAVNQFHNSPGYQFMLDQGNQNVLRNQAASGQLTSGGTNVDLLKYGQGMANQGWQQYITNLLPFLGQANTAAQGIGTVDTGLGQGLNQNLSNQAGLAYGTQTGIGNAQANADLAKYQVGQNSLNAIMGFLNLVAQRPGGSGGQGMSFPGGGGSPPGFPAA